MPAMPPSRSPRSQLTARERVALRRTSIAPVRPVRQSGCGFFVVGLLLIVLVLGLSVAIALRYVVQSLDVIQQADPRRLIVLDPLTANPTAEVPYAPTLRDPFTVLLIGVDKRDDPDDGVRSDTLIVVHVHPGEEWASMLSVPRDTVVQIPRVGQQKINTAYMYGYNNAAQLYGSDTDPSAAGGALAAETVESFLGLNIDYIAQVDFHGFERIVDTLGGITVDVPRPLLDAEYPTEDLGYERLYIPAGLQVLDGHTALRYARSRHSENDFGRSRRQQQVLHAMLRDVRRRGLLDQAALFPRLVKDLEDSVATTMPISDPGVIHDLVNLAHVLTPERILHLSINPDDVQVLAEVGSDIYWNQSDVALQVSRLLAGPEAELAWIQVHNGAGVPGLATRVTNTLTSQGFLMNAAADAQENYDHTVIIDYAGYPKTRQRLAELLGVPSGYIYVPPADNVPPAPYNTDILIILGQDYQERQVNQQTR